MAERPHQPGQLAVASSAQPAARLSCPLCEDSGGRSIYEDEFLRVVHAHEEVAKGLEAFYRVIWQKHVPEWTDLLAPAQVRCMNAVAAVEQAMRSVIAPTKINLASLGNAVPHLHWHVVARFDWDAFYPAPVWAEAHTPASALPQDKLLALRGQREALEQEMLSRLRALVPADDGPRQG